jgi:hypothetical protein
VTQYYSDNFVFVSLLNLGMGAEENSSTEYGINKFEIGGNYIMRSLINYTLNQILLK